MQRFRPIVCIATASYEKFPEILISADVPVPPMTERQKSLERSKQCDVKFLARTSMDEWTKEVQDIIDSIKCT